jgi:hypothetical protein
LQSLFLPRCLFSATYPMSLPETFLLLLEIWNLASEGWWCSDTLWVSLILL